MSGTACYFSEIRCTLGNQKIWKYFGENSEIFAIASYTRCTLGVIPCMEILRRKLQNFCSTNACKKVFLTGGFSLQWCVHIISGNSPKFLGLSRTMLLQFKISYWNISGKSPKLSAISATNKIFRFVWTTIISDISPKFLPALSYLFVNICRLYCSFIKLCYPELPIPEGNQYTALEFWDARFRNWVPFFSTVMDTVYPTLVEVLDKDPLRLKGIYHVHLSVHCLTARVT